MLRKIKLFNKICKIVEALEAYKKGNEEKINKIKDLIPQIKEIILKAEELLEKLQN